MISVVAALLLSAQTYTPQPTSRPVPTRDYNAGKKGSLNSRQAAPLQNAAFALTVASMYKDSLVALRPAPREPSCGLVISPTSRAI